MSSGKFVHSHAFCWKNRAYSRPKTKRSSAATYGKVLCVMHCVLLLYREPRVLELTSNVRDRSDTQSRYTNNRIYIYKVRKVVKKFLAKELRDGYVVIKKSIRDIWFESEI